MSVQRNPSDQSVAVVGLGYVGSTVAATLADRGLDVVGIDVDPRRIAELDAGRSPIHEPGLDELIASTRASGRLQVTTDLARARDADVVVLAVGTPVRADGTLVATQLTRAATALAEHLRPGQLLILKSTVPPGTTRTVLRPLLERSGLVMGVDVDLAFTPERLAEGAALRELTSLPIVAGALTPEGRDRVARFWGSALGVEVIPIDSLEAAEIVKLADNWWIDVNIALANELARVCGIFGADVLDVIRAANSIPKGQGNVNILMPSIGVGGSCLTKDPWMVHRTAAEHGIDLQTPVVGRRVNAGMPAYTADLVAEELARQGRHLDGATVAVLGLAFKNNTSDLRSTPVAAVVDELRRRGARVRLHDPVVDADSAERLFGQHLTEDVEDAVYGAVCVAVLAYHDEFADISFADLPVAEGCVLLDGRAYYGKDTIAELTRLGYVYRGIGRGTPIAPPTAGSGGGHVTDLPLAS